MTEMTPEKLRELEPPDHGFVMEWKQRRDELASAWEADLKTLELERKVSNERGRIAIERQARIEALEKEKDDCRRTMLMVREELVFGGNWEDARAAIDRRLAALAAEEKPG